MLRQQLIAQARQFQSERLSASREEKLRLGIIRIGTRDPASGDWQAIMPNGRVESGRKLFNTTRPTGSIVQGIPTDTGSWLLNERSVRPTQPVKVEEPKGNIKYLYSLIQEGQRNFFVGGWQPKPVKVFTFDPSVQIIHASIDNLGGDRWSINLAYQIVGDENTTIRKLKDQDQVEWSTSTTGGVERCLGHGFWWVSFPPVTTLIGQTTGVNFFDETSSVTTQYIFLFNNATVERIVEEIAYESGTDGDPGNIPNPESQRFTRTSNKSLMQIPRDASLTGLFTDDSNDRERIVTFTLDEDNNVVTEQVETVNQTSHVPLRINARGDRGVGRLTTVGSQTVNRGLWYDEKVNVQTVDIDSSLYLDVQQRGFSGIVNNPPLFPALPAVDQKATVKLFTSGFRQSQKLTVKVFKPEGTGTNYTFYNASYHP